MVSNSERTIRETFSVLLDMKSIVNLMIIIISRFVSYINFSYHFLSETSNSSQITTDLINHWFCFVYYLLLIFIRLIGENYIKSQTNY